MVVQPPPWHSIMRPGGNILLKRTCWTTCEILKSPLQLIVAAKTTRGGGGKGGSGALEFLASKGGREGEREKITSWANFMCLVMNDGLMHSAVVVVVVVSSLTIISCSVCSRRYSHVGPEIRQLGCLDIHIHTGRRRKVFSSCTRLSVTSMSWELRVINCLGGN